MNGIYESLKIKIYYCNRLLLFFFLFRYSAFPFCPFLALLLFAKSFSCLIPVEYLDKRRDICFRAFPFSSYASFPLYGIGKLLLVLSRVYSSSEKNCFAVANSFFSFYNFAFIFVSLFFFLLFLRQQESMAMLYASIP
ncbi:hypothetical protein DFH27DRAFT_122333 [Peziza echinospora]|nr:hypothetical protein DFH27DRAFT_122333 [Peziza echinospora]